MAMATALISGFSAALAAIALLFSVRGQRQNFRLQQDLLRQTSAAHAEGLAVERELEARRSWGEYMAFAIQYPQFSAGFKKHWITVTGGNELQMAFEQYEWYVSKLLLEVEEILIVSPHDSYWESSIIQQLEYHRTYLTGPDFSNYLSHYSPALQRLFKDWRTRRLTQDKQS